ncbi:MAG: DNA mismatch repair endonuclease MutL [Alistipes sp.]
MADKIRLLPEVVANQIAAGEVVNRPASVVKEMMENAIDAGAQRVKVNFRDGGKELIQIVDDGCGMSPIDARMAFDRHATSKIRTVDDIYALSTFGFRGEALASIAAVAQVELRSRQEGDQVGTQTEINGGVFAAQTPVMCPVGSQFFVRNLFFNVPARRRFLDKSTTSSVQIKTEFQRVALCNPQIACELYANDAPLYLLGASSLAGRIVDVVGRHIKQNLLEIEADTSIASLVGYIGRPAAAKRRNAEQYLFVNGRYFKSPYLVSAILKAYEKLIPESCSPSFFLYLSIEPARIDVNVHPQKTEVKFADEQAVWQIVHAAVRETLAKTGAVPPMDFDREGAVEIPVMNKSAVYKEPRAMSDDSYNPFRAEYIDPTTTNPEVDFTGFDVPYHDAQATLSDTAGGGFRATTNSAHLAHSTLSAVEPQAFGRGGGALANAPHDEFEEFESGSGFVDEADSADASQLDFIPSMAEVEQQRLAVTPRPQFSGAMPLCGDYIAAVLDGRFMVVDVRRARERTLYDDYLRMLGHGSSVCQQLLFPERLVLSRDEYDLLEENAVEFAALGFDIDFQGDGTIDVKGTPADLPADTVDNLLFELLQAFATPVSLADVRREKIASVMARSGAKAAPHNFTCEQAQLFLNQLLDTDNFSFSPSGKAIMTEITPEDIRGLLG